MFTDALLVAELLRNLICYILTVFNYSEGLLNCQLFFIFSLPFNDGFYNLTHLFGKCQYIFKKFSIPLFLTSLYIFRKRNELYSLFFFFDKRSCIAHKYMYIPIELIFFYSAVADNNEGRLLSVTVPENHDLDADILFLLNEDGNDTVRA